MVFRRRMFGTYDLEYPYECPKDVGEGADPDWCESFCLGLGCPFLPSCPAYQGFMKEKGLVPLNERKQIDTNK